MQTVLNEPERRLRRLPWMPVREAPAPESEALGAEDCEDLISDVTCLDCDLETAQGLAALGTSGVTSAPVVDDNGVLVGVVSITALAGMRHGDGLEVEDAMRTDVVTASPRASVAEIAKLMASHGLERVPVVTASGRLVGVVTAMDVVRWLAGRLP